MTQKEKIQAEIISNDTFLARTDFRCAISELDGQIKLNSADADYLDYLVAISSGILSGMVDVLWCGDFDLKKGREISEKQVKDFVVNVAKKLGCKKDDISSAVEYLERYHIPSDGNTAELGGGLQHHLRDFGHHPTIVGLVFSLLTQFTGMSYGTDTNGNFIIVPVPESSKAFIGKDVPEKIFNGTIVWFFHLVSDMAGSKATAALNGGTGIPGPILSLAKELSVLPPFNKIQIQDKSLSLFLSKLFNGTLFAKYDENHKIIKETVVRFDLRSELGVIVELGKQSVPVIINECIVRAFYFVRQLKQELKSIVITCLDDFSLIDWRSVVPTKNPTLLRMLTVSSTVLTTVDIAEAIVKEKYWVAINYVGVGRFAVAVGQETASALKVRDLKRIKGAYEKIALYIHIATDENINERFGESSAMEKMSLNLEQTEILYNLEYQKTLNDISKTSAVVNKEKIISRKREWLEEWKKYIETGFPSFMNLEDAKITWYTKEELIAQVENNDPQQPWFRLVLLEAMLFEPYFVISFEKDKKGNIVPAKKYMILSKPIKCYQQTDADIFLDTLFTGIYYEKGYIKRLRKSYGKVTSELGKALKSTLQGVAVATLITVLAILSAGTFAPAIAVALVGTSFPGLSGAALTSACLAYVGGGAISAGGLGMAGGTMIIVGGGTALGLTAGAGAGGAVSAASLMGEKDTILQSAKLMVAIREIFLNDEKDLDFSNTVYEQYYRNVEEVEKEIAELKVKEKVADKKEKKELNSKIKCAEQSAKVMAVALQSMKKYISSFEIGMDAEGK